MAKPDASPVRYDQAVKYFRDKLDLSHEDFGDLVDKMQTRGLTAAVAAQLDLANDVHEAIQRAVRDGTTLEDFKAALEEKLTAAWGEEDPSRIETIFRTQTQKAYSDARWEEQKDPDVIAARPFWKYSAVLDGRTTDICEELNGTVLEADDDFWDENNPPCHPNCRSTIISLTGDQADNAGWKEGKEGPEVDVPEGFGRAPDGEEWEPDWSKYPADLARVAKDQLE